MPLADRDNNEMTWRGMLSRRQFLAATGAAAVSGPALAALAAPPPRSQVLARQTPLADPSDFSLDIPDGKPRPGMGRCVTCRTRDGHEVVGRVLCDVGTSRVVMLPNGRLMSLREGESSATDRSFVPATMEEVAGELLEGQFAGFRTRHTRRYLHVYNTSDLFFTAASRILETMFPGVFGYSKSQKIEVHEPEVPLVVIMFRTEQEFQAFQSMPRGVVAYYSPVSNFVVMYEESRLGKVAPEIAAAQAITTIAHEGVHQILHNIGVQQRLSHWPMWTCEGLAEYFAPTTTDKRMKWKGPGELNELRLAELDRYLRQRPADAHGDLVQQTIEAAQLGSLGYAAAWALNHFLIKRQPQKFFGYLQEVSKIGPLENSGKPDKDDRIPANRALFAKHFDDDMDRLETQVVEHLRKLLA